MTRFYLAFLLALLALDASAYSTTPCLHGETGTCRLSTGTQSDVQAALDASAAGGNGTLDANGDPRVGSFDGDSVYIPAGNFTWTTYVQWTNKNVLLKGAGGGTCPMTTSAHNCSCDSGSNTCISATGSGARIFANPMASSTTKMQWRISSVYVSNGGNNGAIMVNSNVNFANIPATAAYGFRIDNSTFNFPAANVEGIILVVGPVFGLIDHVNLVNLGEASICTFAVVPTESDFDGTCGDATTELCGAYNFSIGYHPGVANRNLVIEDSQFWTSPSGNTTMFDTYYYGGKVIFRHNQIYNGTFYSHWTGGGNLNGLWLEYYNNVHDGANAGGSYPMRLQGGATGLFYNNTFKNWSDNSLHFGEDRSLDTLGHGVPGPLLSCNGSRAIDGNAGDGDAPGWPCLAQTGRANSGIATSSGSQSPAADSFPTYLWNNGTQDACAACTDHTAESCSGCTNTVTISSEAPNYITSTAHPNGDVDWAKTSTKPSGAGTHTLTYTPLTYPHPLQQAATGPSAPTNFRLVRTP